MDYSTLTLDQRHWIENQSCRSNPITGNSSRIFFSTVEFDLDERHFSQFLVEDNHLNTDLDDDIADIEKLEPV